MGEQVEVVIKVHHRTVLGDAFQHGGKFPQYTLTPILTQSLAQPQSGFQIK